jgi:ankyrin repeat protein
LRDFLLSSSHRGTPLNENIDAHLMRSSAPKDGDEDEDETFEGFTLLTLACVRGDWPSARCLLRFGADVNARDRRDRAPVDAAVHEGHFDLADALVRWAEERGVRMGEQ